MVTGEVDNPVFFKDPLLDEVASSDCHLAIRLDRDAIHYAVTHHHSEECLFVKSVKRDPELAVSQVEFLREQLNLDPVFNREYQSVSLALAGEPALAIPNGFTQEQSKARLLSLHLGKEVERTAEENIEMSGLQWVFEDPEEIEQVAKKQFPNIYVTCNSAWMAQSMLRKSKWSKDRLVYIDLSSSFFDLYIVKNGQLEFYNCFDSQTETDVFYHLMNTLQKLKIQAENQRIIISGPVDIGGATLKLFKKYLKNAELNFGMDFYKMARGLSGVKKQYFISLFNQFVCA